MKVGIPNFEPRYKWSDSNKKQIIFAYYYGILDISLVSGILIEAVGPKHIVVCSVFSTGLLNILIVQGAKWHWAVTFCCRFASGIASRLIYPYLILLMARWAPPNERGKFASALLGHTIGTAFIWVYINYTIPNLGWQASFYVNTILVMVYCVAFFFLTASSSEQHKFISPEELDHIKRSQGIDWEDELLELNQSYSVFGTSIMDNVFFYQDRFEILVDARGFKPEEIKCTVTPRSVEVLAQTENQIENAQRRMTLTRQYVLPKNASPENGTCCFSNEGIFLVTAPWA